NSVLVSVGKITSRKSAWLFQRQLIRSWHPRSLAVVGNYANTGPKTARSRHDHRGGWKRRPRRAQARPAEAILRRWGEADPAANAGGFPQSSARSSCSGRDSGRG